ncbi:MAG TPA: iron ABC transporter permease [Candidatus Competibacter sp.]|nr:iron ABC transporter permease [Candidatus Competibacter sp.]HRW65189.1 iron ABC transporter permease [Candidatus Competibacter sp.]
MSRVVDADVRRGRRVIVVLAVLATGLTLAGLLLGPLPLSPWQVLTGLIGGDERLALIMLEIRLPRVVLGWMVGASLGLSGAALQGLLRNPLAEPGILGVSASAGLGAVLALYFGLAQVSAWALPLCALGGALLATASLAVLATRDPNSLGLILAGLAVSSLAVALTSLALNLAPNPLALSEMVLWLLGSLRDRGLNDVALAAPFMAAGWVLLLSAGRGLDALTLGEEAARSLGIGLGSLRAQVISGTALAVGAATAVTGAIGFVGLIAPHLLRPWLGHQPGRLLLPSALAGAVLLMAADLLVRLVPTRQELMLGVVTALIGAPFFLHLLLRGRRTLS